MISIVVDQSPDTVRPVFEALETSAFFISTVRIVPAAFSRRAHIHLGLGGGSTRDPHVVLGALSALPAVIATEHVPPPV